jgi:hypothetical protein
VLSKKLAKKPVKFWLTGNSNELFIPNCEKTPVE